MAYATGSASTCTAVLQALATFCTSYGWTVNYNNTYTGLGWWLSISKGTCYLNFTVPTAGGLITMYGATSYNSSSAPSAQPNVSAPLVCNPGQTSSGVNPGPYSAYHFFSSSTGAYLHCIIEVSAGVFAHFHGGQLSAAGGASPAIYITVSNWSRYAASNGFDTIPSNPDGSGNCKPFSADYGGGSGSMASPYNGYLIGCTVDSAFLWFQGYNGSSPARLGATGNSGASGWERSAHVRSPNTFNGVAPLIAIPVFVERATGNIYSFIGDTPDIRFFNMKNNNAKDEITIGSDVWKLFPIIANNPTINVGGGSVSSYPYGLAFKKSA
jgi:hypothetical protein